MDTLTPRTDAILSIDQHGALSFVLAKHARQLERELSAQQETIAALTDARDRFRDALLRADTGDGGSIELRPDDYADRSIMDEIVAQRCRVHLERMDDHWYCLIVETDKRRVMVSIGTPEKYRRKVNAKVYEDAPQDAALSQDTKEHGK